MPALLRHLFRLLLLAPAISAAAGTTVVETAPVARETVSIPLERPGTLAYRRVLRVYNREEGRLVRFPWYEGDRVKRGQLLLELDSRLLHSELRKAEADLRLKEQRLTRLEKLVKQNAASTDEVAEARTELEVARAELEILRTRLDYTTIRAPFDAIVLERLADAGDVKPKYSHLLTLADPASLVVRFRLEDDLLGEIETGQEIRVRLGGREEAARIRRIFPRVDEASRLGTVEAGFASMPEGTRAGAFVRVRLSTRPRERLLVPFPALRVDRRGEYVYLVQAGHARRQGVKSGRRIGGRVEILSGLKAGEQVVVRGFLGLENDTPITVSAPAAPKTRRLLESASESK